MKNDQYLNADKRRHRTILSLRALCKMKVLGTAMFLPAFLCLMLTSCAAENLTSKPAPAIRTSQLDPPETTPPETMTSTTVSAIQSYQLQPLPTGVAAQSLHAPFAGANCSFCHEKEDTKAPGPLLKPTNEICLDCHEDFKQYMARKFKHSPVMASCSNCHNAHNSKYTMLLVNDISSLCLGCHSDLKSVTTEAKVKHDVTLKGKACSNCHNPHGANVEHLLISLPYDLCVTCHGNEGVLDHEGLELTNFKMLLAENPEHHGPVKAKDCSACHNPHGEEYFRLLKQQYPPKFYSSYNPEFYALCFNCHEERVFEEPRTETLTLFRNGDKNLHYIHVSKMERGRTCRACHEVHAAKQKHHIRDGVPYGSKGWVLEIRYSPTPFGGECGKNCHDSRSYNNQSVNSTITPETRK